MIRAIARGKRGPHRKGAVLVEFAVTLPISILVFFAAFEFCRAAMVRHTVDNAVYEAARRGILPGATAADVEDEANRVLATIGIAGAEVEVTPSSIAEDTPEVTVRIRTQLDENGYVTPVFLSGVVVDRELTMRREGAGTS